METKQSSEKKDGFGQVLSNVVRLNRMVWKEAKGLFVLLTILVFLSSTSGFWITGANALLINFLTATGIEKNINDLWWLVGLLGVAMIGSAVLGIVQSYVFEMFYYFLDQTFEMMLIRKKTQIDVAAYEDPKYNDLFNRISEYGINMLNSFARVELFIIQDVLMLVLASAVIAYAKWWILMIIVICEIPNLIVELQYGEKYWGIIFNNTENQRRYWSYRMYFEKISALVEMRLFQNIDYFFNNIKRLYGGLKEAQKNIEKKRTKQKILASFFSQSGILLATAYFVWMVYKGEMQIGTMTFVLASVSTFRSSLSIIFGDVGRQYQSSLFMNDIFKLLDIPELVKKPLKGVVLNKKKTPSIEFSKVSFRYPGTSKVVLKDFSLKIEPGERVAFVGINGAGKTTIVKLLCRFYDPDQGSIKINGVDLKEIDLASWYSQLGILFQDYENYDMIVKDSIAVGRTDKKMVLQKIKRAAQASEADVFIEEWEKKYNQMLGRSFTGGVEPSIGQWQKLALARTFYRDPKVMILDEPTASVDAEAEAKIFSRIEALPGDRTVLLISHRFSTVRHAGKICVIKNGRLIEYGTHEYLLAKEKGIYAKLFKLQAKGYK